MKSEDKMYKSIKIYRIFRNANIVCLFSEKRSASFIKQYIYILIPFIFCLADWLNMYINNVLYSKETKIYGYANDLSDSFGLTILFLVSYFLSGYYQRKASEFLKYGLDEKCEDNIKKQKPGALGKMFGIIFMFLGLLIGTIFFINKINNDIHWLHKINAYAKLYHGLLVGITWYNSLTILGMATAAGFMVYWSIESGKLHYVENFYNKNISIIKAFDILACTLSYGFFYIIGTVLIILNDNIASGKYNITALFDEFLPAVLLIAFIFVIVVLEIIPLIRLWIYMKEKKNKRLKFLNDKIEEIDKVYRKKHYFHRMYYKIKYFAYRKYLKEYRNKMFEEMEDISSHGVFNDIIKSRILLFSTFIIPLTGVVIQAISVLIRK